MALCKGFLTTRIDYDNQQILETLYALLEDGTVLATNEHKRGNTFLNEDYQWHVSKADWYWLKDSAEFIGNYPIPSLGEPNGLL